MTDRDIAEITMLATVFNLQVNMEILEINTQILRSHQEWTKTLQKLLEKEINDT